jgi:hypothetical protein
MPCNCQVNSPICGIPPSWETHIPYHLSLLFLHDAVVSLEALGYTLPSLARGQDGTSEQSILF